LQAFAVSTDDRAIVLEPVLRKNLVRLTNAWISVQIAVSYYCQTVDYEEGEVLCLHCGSQEVEQCGSAFSPITSKKSA